MNLPTAADRTDSGAPEREPSEVGSTSWRTGLLVGVGACASVFALDQISKNMVLDSMALGERRHVFGPLSLVLTFNSGSAFGIGAGGGAVIGIFAVVIVLGVLFAGKSQHAWPVRLVQGLVIGGALGNLWDRISRPPDGFLSGHVVDFLRVPHWPVFNVADIAITCGAIALAWLITRIPVDGEGEPDGVADESVSDMKMTETVADDR